MKDLLESVVQHIADTPWNVYTLVHSNLSQGLLVQIAQSWHTISNSLVRAGLLIGLLGPGKKRLSPDLKSAAQSVFVQ